MSIDINKTFLYLIFRFVSWDEVWQDNKFLFDFFQCFSTNQNERAVLAQVCQKWREVLYQPEFWREVRPVIHCRAIRSWSSPGSTCTSSSTATSSTDNCIKQEDSCSSNMAGINERTFIMIKPDGVQRGLVGDIIKRFEKKGFKLVAMKFMQVRSP